MTVHAVLQEARDLLAVPIRWTRSTYARTAQGPIADALRTDAIAWCAVGAVRKAAGGDSNLNSAAQTVLEAAAKPIIAAWWATLSTKEQQNTHPTIPCWQDHASTTHADVMRLFDSALTT